MINEATSVTILTLIVVIGALLSFLAIFKNGQVALALLLLTFLSATFFATLASMDWLWF